MNLPILLAAVLNVCAKFPGTSENDHLKAITDFYTSQKIAFTSNIYLGHHNFALLPAPVFGILLGGESNT